MAAIFIDAVWIFQEQLGIVQQKPRERHHVCIVDDFYVHWVRLQHASRKSGIPAI
jgi:hypothetical protein